MEHCGHCLTGILPCGHRLFDFMTLLGSGQLPTVKCSFGETQELANLVTLIACFHKVLENRVLFLDSHRRKPFACCRLNK